MTKLKTHIKNEKRWKKSICKFLKCNDFDLNKVPEHKFSQMLKTALLCSYWNFECQMNSEDNSNWHILWWNDQNLKSHIKNEKRCKFLQIPKMQ